MRISMLTVPVEPNYMDFVPEVRPDTDVFVASTRSEGQLPVMPKIAIVSLIKWMEAHGYTKEQYDYYDVDMLLPSDQELATYFKNYQPNVVGLSAVVSTCYSQVQRIATLIRQSCPDAWIVLGGSLTASSNLVLNKTDVDICVVGDGEIVWVDFLNYAKTNGRNWNHEALKNITGLAYLDEAGKLQFTGYGKAIPGEMNPFPDYEILASGLKDRQSEMANYFRPGLGSTHFQTDPRSHEPDRRPMLAQLWSSKGCVARCTFCQRSTKGYRVHAVESLDDHLKMLATRFNVGFIHILDENFGSNTQYAYELAKTMQRNNMLWMASGVRVSSVGFEDIKFFKEHGCVSLKFGVESGSQMIMDVMEKKFTVDQVFRTLKHCADLEIYSPLAVMVGMPGETNETATETGRFLGRLAYMQGIDPRYLGASIFYALPLTGTPLYLYGQQVGVIGKQPDDEEEYLLSVSGTGASKINYVNLNGAGIKDVIWWDWLVRLEANRTFIQLNREKPLISFNFMQNAIIADKQREIIGRALTLRQIIDGMKNFSLRGMKAKIFYCVDTFMEHYVVPSSLVAYLPRWCIYPMLRTLVYMEYLLQGMVLKLLGKSFNLWKKWPAISRQVEFARTASVTVNINDSLRRVVRKRAQVSPIESPEQETQDILSVGL